PPRPSTLFPYTTLFRSHYAWNAWDLTWWYAAPVSGLGFHDNSVDFRIDPGPGVDAPPGIAWSPDLGMITFENRARTVASESTSTDRKSTRLNSSHVSIS